MSFTKLDGGFASSSLFAHGLEVVGFFSYLMSQADARGVVTATVPDMAARCRVTPERIEAMLALLQEPDRWSRTPDQEGRRIEIIREPEWGVLLVNHAKYRAKRDPEERKRQVREAVQRLRARRKAPVITSNHGKPRKPQKAQAEAEAGRKEERAEAEPRVVYDERPTRPPADRAEQATTDTIRTLQNKLGSKLCALSEHPNSRDMVPAWCRRVTAYKRRDGTAVNGVADYRTLNSIDRLEKSIADADCHLNKLNTEAPHA